MNGMDLVDFLTARLDEDEQVARAAKPGPWRAVEMYADCYYVESDCGGHANIASESSSGDLDRGDAEHIARHDPARVLADVAAKRQLVVALAGYLPADMHFLDDVTASRAHVALLGLTHLALPYADHDQFRGEWRP